MRASSPFTWLNLLCLDAPLVAVSWYGLFALTFGVEVSPAGAAALFMTAWLIYLADRLGDSLSILAHAQKSLRQEFCASHSQAWIVALALVALADAVVIAIALEWATIIAGAAVGVLAISYLVVNQLSANIRRIAPLKEISIGSLFAAGTLIPLIAKRSTLDTALMVAAVLFASVCSLNCISIAAWEAELDSAQKRGSIATRFPRIGAHLRTVGTAIAAASLLFGMVHFEARLAAAALGVSASCIVALDVWRAWINSDTRTALADLVLLAPALLGVLAHAVTQP